MNQPKQAEIKHFLLADADIDALKDIQQFLLIPHRIQELLSAEQTPTISVVIPAYEALLGLIKLAGQRWPRLAHAIKATSDALEQYMGYTRTTRVYALAVCTSLQCGCPVAVHECSRIILVTNPGFKKQWMVDHWTPAQPSKAEEWLVEAVSLSSSGGVIHMGARLLTSALCPDAWVPKRDACCIALYRSRNPGHCNGGTA